jgi:Spy/CpxP family protein refolding chaperone
MSPRLTQVLLALSLLLNCFVLAGFLYRSWVEPPRIPGRPGGPPSQGQGPNRWTNPLEALANDLKLDESTKMEIQPILEKYAALRRERYRDIGKQRESMSTELQKSQFDMAKLDALVDQMGVMRAEQQKQNLRAIEELAAKLNPEKQAELHKILAEWYGGWRSGGPGGSRPGRPTQ